MKRTTSVITETAPGRGRPAKRTKAPSKKSYRVPRHLALVNVGKGFPKKIQFTHTYAEFRNLDTNALGVIGTRFYSCNGMYDPDATGVGHQPYYFDQLASLYQHFTVLSSKMTISFAFKNNTVSTPLLCGVLINDDTVWTPGTDINAAIENTDSASTLLPLDKTVTLVKYWNAKAAFGGNTMDNDNLQGSAAANPTEQQYFMLFVDGSAAGVAHGASVRIKIEYTAVWDELRDIAGS